jgi:hypothetical protein
MRDKNTKKIITEKQFAVFDSRLSIAGLQRDASETGTEN